MYGLKLSKINLKDIGERLELNSFLVDCGLILDEDVDYSVVLRDEDGCIKGTSSKAGSVFKCFAISEELRGVGAASTLISSLIDRLFEEGKSHAFIFTKPDKARIFTSLNFKLIHEVENAALLEYGMYDINKALGSMAYKYNIDGSTAKGALVMNCNPFTLGHRYLVEEASKTCEEVLLFVVEEDKSIFPFDVRYNLIKEGISDLKNVRVIPGGEYIISSATFPTYFLRNEGIRHRAYANLDAGIFAKYFCKRFGIIKRFVGEEPYDISTRMYNESLQKILPEHGVQLLKIERRQSNGEWISASRVRDLLKSESLHEVQGLVPESTWNFLNSAEGSIIIEKLKTSNS